MGANITFVGSGQTVVWGTNTINAPTGAGVVISASNKYSGETIPVLNNLGVPDGMVIVQGMTEASIEAYALGTTNPPNIGDVASVANENVYIDSVDATWEQKGIKKIRISGKALPA